MSEMHVVYGGELISWDAFRSKDPKLASLGVARLYWILADACDDSDGKRLLEDLWPELRPQEPAHEPPAPFEPPPPPKRERTVSGEARRQVLVRDGYLCQKCGRDVGGLDVHHIEAFAYGGSDDPDNLIVLCRGCHHEWTFHAEGMIDWKEWLWIPGSTAVVAFAALQGHPDAPMRDFRAALQIYRDAADRRIADAKAHWAEQEALRPAQEKLRKERAEKRKAREADRAARR